MYPLKLSSRDTLGVTALGGQGLGGENADILVEQVVAWLVPRFDDSLILLVSDLHAVGRVWWLPPHVMQHLRELLHSL